MRYLKIAGVVSYRFTEHLLFGITLWILLAILLPRMKLNGNFTPAENGVKIYILSNGVHTDFVVPVRSSIYNWDTVLAPQWFNADSSFTHVALGWGDQGFFLNTPTWADLKFSTAVVAAFGIGESAMHVTYRKAAPPIGKSAVPFTISQEQYKRLIAYIRSSFRARENRMGIIDHAGYGSYDKFFESNGSYSLFTTCNEWTGDGMEAAGLPVGIWTPLEPGIMANRH